MGFFEAGWTGFLALWAMAYGALVFVYFSAGLALDALSARHPERRIQDRAPHSRKVDIGKSLIALVSIAGYVAGGQWLQAKGWTLFSVWEMSIWSLAGGFLVSLILYDAWFYWFHRLMHTRVMYRWHAQHHQAVTPTAWSNNNDTLIGAFFEQSYFVVAPLILPAPALVFVAHKLFDQVTGMIGHAGYEFFASPGTRRPYPGVCTTYHDQHHSHFKYNFANTFTVWDRLFGTLHPGYDAKVRAFETGGTTETDA